MGDLPRILARPDLPSQNLPRTNPNAYGAQVGAALVDAGNMFQRIDDAAVEAEARKTIAVTRERIKGSLQQTDDENVDPLTYHSTASGLAEELYQQALKSTKSDKARALIADGMAPFLAAAQSDVQHTYRTKQVAKAKGDSLDYLETAERELSQAVRPLDIQNKENEIVQHIRTMQGVNSYTPVEGVKIIQQIRERDSYRRAVRELGISQDPLKDVEQIQKKYPNIDPDKALQLLGVAHSRNLEIDRMREKVEKQVHEQNLLMDTMDAVNGKMTQLDLDARARARRYTPGEYNAVRRSMEEGGSTNPQVYVEMERLVREGKITDYSIITGNQELDRQAKSTLMGLVQQSKDEKHFSKSPEYQEATKELRAAVSPKGPMESFDRTEQARYLSGITELWNRTQKGEPAMAVSRDIQSRIAREPTQGEKPLFLPRFQSEQDLIGAFRDKLIDRATFDKEAQMLKEWQAYNKQEAERAARPKTDSRRR